MREMDEGSVIIVIMLMKPIKRILVLGLLGVCMVAIAQDKEPKKKIRIVYPKQSKFQFQGLNIDGELKNPG